MRVLSSIRKTPLDSNKRDKMTNLLIKTAFACMACDGNIDQRELECVNKFVLEEHICACDELTHELNRLVDEFNKDSNEFVVRYFSELKKADPSRDEQLKILRYALAIIQADEQIDYQEIKFFKIIRSLLTISDEEIREEFEDIEAFLTEDILSDPIRSFTERSFFNFGTSDVKLMHNEQSDESSTPSQGVDQEATNLQDPKEE